jgi:hypothetical protein
VVSIGMTQSLDSILAQDVRRCVMREEINVEVSATDRERLAAGYRGSQHPTKTCLAGRDHSGDRRGLRHGGN